MKKLFAVLIFIHSACAYSYQSYKSKGPIVLDGASDERKINAILTVGASKYSGLPDFINQESGTNIGLELETYLAKKITLGLGVGLNNFDLINDNNFREFELNNLWLEANSKFYLTEKMVRPFIGVALGLSFAEIERVDETGELPNKKMAKFKKGYVAPVVGADLILFKNWGIRLEGKYAFALAGDEDRRRLINDLKASNWYVLNMGLIGKF
ncbi:MAG: DUF3575 domain-containing protein [Deltaproteobacteria bacterium]|nr:MAG: DUF3575 domain-containing protein [Deltaproteobacteria bacterium]